MKNILTRSDLALAVLDVEASALGAGSYPIEVGVALVRSASLPIATGARMIRPTEEWRNCGTWSSSSQSVHGISHEVLEQDGHPAEEVCDWLNSHLGTKTIVASDAPRYDQDWLDTLFDASDREQQFTLYNFEILTRDFDPDQHRHLKYLLDRAPVPHRAGPDSLRLASKLLEAHLGYPPRSEPLEHTAGSAHA